MTTRTWFRSMAALLAAALALSLAACGSSSKSSTSGTSSSGASAQPGKGKPAVTLGDKNFTEQYILGELYAQALRAKGYTVNLKSNIGTSEITDKALTSGKIDLYPEYTGTILSDLAHQTKRPSDPDAAYQAAKNVTMTRLYLDTMQDVLSHAQSVVLDDKLRGVLPFLPLSGEQPGSRAPAPAPAPPPPTPSSAPPLAPA